MIFYFSATGNCKYVAEQISDEDKLIAVVDCIKNEKINFKLSENENIGFVFPTYFWGLPSIVEDFLQKLVLKQNGRHYTYLVATYGTTTGQMAGMADKILKAKGFPLDAKFSVKMPDTWTVMFDLSDKEKVSEKNASAEKEIDEIARQIKSKVKGDYIKSELPYFIANSFHPTYEKARMTKHLNVTDVCIGCGLCEKKCPIQAIEMQNGKPVWVKDKCAMCLGCLHRCPKFAIQYGKATLKHGQYKNPNVKI